MATFINDSFSNLSRILFPYTFLPSFPAKGDVFMPKDIEIVGLSTETRGSATGFSFTQIVSPIYTPSTPDKIMISPALAVSISAILVPE